MPLRERGNNAQENAIPLCFVCHAEVERYNADHPRGRRIKRDELERRREQVYEEYTSHLVPNILVSITQDTLKKGKVRKLPNVGCTVRHKGNGPQIQLLLRLEMRLGTRRKTIRTGHYGGAWRWKLNRGQEVWGHFAIPRRWVGSRQRLMVIAYPVVLDCYDRRHTLLPFAYIYDHGIGNWYFEPCPEHA